MAYTMTPKRRAALRKAQLASARKRRGKGKGKLAKANRTASRARKVAVVAATGGLALAAIGVGGTYYARKTAGGGPKRKKVFGNYSGSTVVNSSSRALDRSLRRAERTMRQVDRYGTTGRPGRQLVVYTGTNRRTRLRNTGRRNARRNNMSLGQVRRNLSNPNYVWQL